MKPQEMRQLDNWLAEKVMGWYLCYRETGGYYCDLFGKEIIMVVDNWHPTTDIAQAFEVVEKLRQNDFWFKCTYKSGMFLSDIDKSGWDVGFRCVRAGIRGDHYVEHEDLKMAVCLAAKKAQEAK